MTEPDLTPKQLAGQISDFLLKRIKANTSFGKLSEAKQQGIIDACDADGKHIVQAAIHTILNAGSNELDVTINNVTAKKDSISASITAKRDSRLGGELFKHAHSPAKVTLLNVDEKDLLDLGESAKPDPDQQPMFSESKDVVDRAEEEIAREFAQDPPRSTPMPPSTAKRSPTASKKAAAKSTKKRSAPRKLKVVSQGDVTQSEDNLAVE